jgi:hypothetical protein
MTVVCLAPTATLDYVDGGGHLWAYLNWALGFRALGCRVIWLEWIAPASPEEQASKVQALRRRLAPFGLAGDVAIGSLDERPVPRQVAGDCASPDDVAGEADLLVNLRYAMDRKVVRRFRRSALLDIDPGLLQIWMASGQLEVADHDVHFTISETVADRTALVPGCGVRWLHTPPAVALDAWPAMLPAPSETAGTGPAAGAATVSAGDAYTTVSHWWGEWTTWRGSAYADDKRSAFRPYLSLPSRVAVRLELALPLSSTDGAERAGLERCGWSVRNASDVASTPDAYRRYVQASRGEFSCAKASYVRYRTAWISDRTLCYLASGRPAVVQDTGPTRLLAGNQGVRRFSTLAEAAHALTAMERDRAEQSRLARKLAETWFDARRVAASLLERAV